MEWKDKKILVTGAKGFLGKDLSKNLLELGSKVYSIDHSINKAKDMGGRIVYVEGDVSKKETWDGKLWSNLMRLLSKICYKLENIYRRLTFYFNHKGNYFDLKSRGLLQKSNEKSKKN